MMTALSTALILPRDSVFVSSASFMTFATLRNNANAILVTSGQGLEAQVEESIFRLPVLLTEENQRQTHVFKLLFI